jgi:hypothetical protein
MDKESRWYLLGVEARRSGRAHGDNPLLLPAAASFVSSEPKVWRAQMDAWWEGWEAEDRRCKRPSSRRQSEGVAGRASRDS